MRKIEKLTPEQIAQFPEFVDKWTKIGLSTEPANRPKAEAAIKEMYQIAGLKPPKIVWCGSPLSQGLIRAIILDKKLMKDIGSVRASVRDSVRDSVWASVWDSVGDSVGDSVRDSVRDSVWASVRASVRDSVWASIGASVGDSVWASVRASVWASVRTSVRDSVRDSVWASVWASVGDSVRDSVWASVWASVWDSVGDSVGDSVRASIYGQHDAGWLSFYDFFAGAVELKEQTAKLSGLRSLAQNAGWTLPHENICWVSERHHILERDERGRLHSIIGPACAFPDGWAIYAIHGIRVPSYIIEHPEQITIKKISTEKNIEVRRIMIERYGEAKYILDSGMKPVASNPRWGDLYVQRLESGRPIAMINVTNRTAEPDGTFKHYMIPINPELYNGDAGKIPQAAVASTWRLTKGGKELAFANWRDYSPIQET